MILYRSMVMGDVAAALSLCRAAGWNQTLADWELFLKLSPQGCRVAVDDEGMVRGTVATVRYEDHFSWIGMVIVDPVMQRQGIGIQLLRESLQILSEEETVKLDATPAGRQIYLQLDFQDEYPISRMEISKMPDNLPPGSPAQLIRTEDMPLLLEYDRKVFGAGRERLLNAILKRSPQFAFIDEDKDGIRGYCFGRVGHDFSHIGPVIARDIETAKNVSSAALRACSGSPVVIDALVNSAEWLHWLASLGFNEQRQLMRMYRGANAYPGLLANQFAILGPEFG